MKHHTLTLTSGPVGSKSSMLWNAECSCGSWRQALLSATKIRELHAEHLQNVIGPDREPVPGRWGLRS